MFSSILLLFPIIKSLILSIIITTLLFILNKCNNTTNVSISYYIKVFIITFLTANLVIYFYDIAFSNKSLVSDIKTHKQLAGDNLKIKKKLETSLSRSSGNTTVGNTTVDNTEVENLINDLNSPTKNITSGRINEKLNKRITASLPDF